MRFTVHDVGHGQCISLIHNNKAMLWDCGSDIWSRPSEFLSDYGVTEIRRLIITNYDHDHIADLPDLNKKFKIIAFRRNKLENSVIRKIKKDSNSHITNAMEVAFEMNDGYNYNNSIPEFPNVTLKTYHNNYGTGNNEFIDTNNLSLVSFLTVNDTKIIIPGDLEKAGWEALIKRSDFRNELKDVDIFVASHHGRENGFCDLLFQDFPLRPRLCTPKVFIFSDSNIEFSTQESMSLKYGSLIDEPKCVLHKSSHEAFLIKDFTSYLRSITTGYTNRKVLTTRNDGTFYFNL